MKKDKLFPVIYGFISALISFLAIFFICQRTFKINISIAVGIAGIGAIIFYIWSYFRAHASIEIKRITAKFHLTDQELAKITGMKASDFPIYNNKLQLIIPKRKWAKVLYQLQQYENNHDKKNGE